MVQRMIFSIKLWNIEYNSRNRDKSMEEASIEHLSTISPYVDKSALPDDIKFTITLNATSVQSQQSKNTSLSFTVGLPLKDFSITRIWIDQTEGAIKSLLESIIDKGFDTAQSIEEKGDSIPNDFNEMTTISASNINSKFQVSQGAFVGNYGDPSLFLKGLDDRIGLPDFRIDIGIKNEHCYHADSQTLFKTFNYGGTESCPATEYEFVCNPDPSKEYPGTIPSPSHPHRSIQEVSTFLNHPYSIRAGLTRAEVVAIRLFSGPMYMKYNAVLRGFPPTIVESLQGNRYTTTIHSIVSGIIKLSQIAELPLSRKVYRGLGGMLLPERFWKEDEFGCRGGVELGFMSTTTNRDVAVMYSGKAQQLCTVFEIDVGQIDRGASIQWLSQYPGEEEFLMPPLSNLEVVGSPWMERTHNGNESLLVMKLRINVNLKSKTLDELRATRQRLHVATIENLISDTVRLVSDKSALEDFYALLEEERNKPPEWFNDDNNFRKCQEDMMNMKKGTIEKDVLLRLAKRSLLGLPSDEMEAKQYDLICKEQTSLLEYLNDHPLTKPTSTDMILFNQISKCHNELEVNLTYVTAATRTIYATLGDNREKYRLLYETLSAVGHLITGEVPRVETLELNYLTNKKELVSLPQIDWVLEMKKPELYAKIKEIGDASKRRIQIYDNCFELEKAFEIRSKELQKGMKLAAREQKGLEGHKLKITARISELSDQINNEQELSAFALREDSRTLSSLTPLSRDEQLRPWLLAAAPGPLLEQKLSTHKELSQAVSAVECIPYSYLKLQSGKDERRRRRELLWVEAQLQDIVFGDGDGDGDGSRKKNAWCETHISAMNASYKGLLALDLSSVHEELKRLEARDAENVKQLMPHIALRMNSYESKHAKYWEPFATEYEAVGKLLQETFDADKERRLQELYYFMRRIVKLYPVTSPQPSGGGVEESQNRRMRMQTEFVAQKVGTESPTLVDKAEFLSLVEDTKRRCEIYESDPSIPPDAEDVYGAGSKGFHDENMAKYEHADFDMLMQKYGSSRGEGLIYLTFQHSDFRTAMGALSIFQLTDDGLAVKENSLRGTKESIFLYDAVKEGSEELNRNGIHDQYGSDFSQMMSNISKKLCSRSKLMSDIIRLRMLLAIIEKLRILNLEAILSEQMSTVSEEQAIDLLAVELKWRSCMYCQLRTNDSYLKLQSLEDMLQYGIGGDGDGHDLTLTDTVVNRMQAIKTLHYSNTGFTNRLHGTIKLLSALAEDDELPWSSDFDTEALSVAIDMLYSQSSLADVNDTTLSIASKGIPNETVLNKMFGVQTNTDIMRVDPNPRRHEADKAGWKGELTMLDEFRFAKELFWAHRVTDMTNKSSTSSSSKSSVSTSRRSFMRLLEIISFCFSEKLEKEIELTDSRVGMGGMSLDHCCDKEYLPSMEIEEQMRWFGATSIFFQRVGPFDVKQIGGNEISTVSYPSLKKLETHFLLGHVLSCGSKVMFNIGNKNQTALTLQSFSMCTGVSSHSSGYKIDLPRGASPEQMQVMLELMKAPELLALVERREIYQNRKVAEVSVGIPLGMRERHKQMILRVDSMNICSSTIGYCDVIGIETSLNDILLSYPNVRVLNMQSCNLTSETLVAMQRGLRGMVRLEELLLIANCIDDDGVIALVSVIPTLSKLETLYLHYNKIGDRGAIALAQAFASMPCLKNVMLNDNRIGTEGALALAANFKHMTQMSVFNVGANKFPKEAVEVMLTAWEACGKKQGGLY